MNACVGPRCERCDGREDVTVNRERTRQAFPQSFQRLDFKKMFRELQYMALGTYSLDPVHSPVSSCSCVKPQMFLLYANMYIRLRTSSLFFLRRRERERGPRRRCVASQIRQGGQHLCALSQGYISSAKPVKSALGARWIPRRRRFVTTRQTWAFE